MNKIKKCEMVAVWIAVILVGFTSCKENKEPEPEPDLSCAEIMGMWYRFTFETPDIDIGCFIDLKTDGTYSLAIENETVNGIYKITEKKRGTFDISWYDPRVMDVVTFSSDATLYKMLASGSNVSDQIWMYVTYREDKNVGRIYVHLYSGNELVRVLYCFRRNDGLP
jgi:hypothetical protein